MKGILYNTAYRELCRSSPEYSVSVNPLAPWFKALYPFPKRQFTRIICFSSASYCTQAGGWHPTLKSNGRLPIIHNACYPWSGWNALQIVTFRRPSIFLYPHWSNHQSTQSSPCIRPNAILLVTIHFYGNVWCIIHITDLCVVHRCVWSRAGTPCLGSKLPSVEVEYGATKVYSYGCRFRCIKDGYSEELWSCFFGKPILMAANAYSHRLENLLSLAYFSSWALESGFVTDWRPFRRWRGCVFWGCVRISATSQLFPPNHPGLNPQRQS